MHDATPALEALRDNFESLSDQADRNHLAVEVIALAREYERDPVAPHVAYAVQDPIASYQQAFRVFGGQVEA